MKILLMFLKFFKRWVSVARNLSDKKVLNYVQVKLMFWKVLWFFKLLFKFIFPKKKGISIAKTYLHVIFVYRNCILSFWKSLKLHLSNIYNLSKANKKIIKIKSTPGNAEIHMKFHKGCMWTAFDILYTYIPE